MTNKPTPNEVLAKWDAFNPVTQMNATHAFTLAEALRDAIRQRDEARAEVASWTRDGLQGKLAIAAERDQMRKERDEARAALQAIADNRWPTTKTLWAFASEALQKSENK